MNFKTLSKRIADAFPGLSPQLQQAARYVLDRPDDVGLMSMRGLAESAGVHPSTMVRLVRVFGFDGYNKFREIYKQRLRARPVSYLQRVRDLQSRGSGSAAIELLAESLAANAENLRETFEVNSADKFVACAKALSKGRRIFVTGLRSCYPVAFFYYYAYRMFGDNIIILDGLGGTFSDDLRTISKGDVIFAVSFDPYTSETVRAVNYAVDHGATAVVLSDSMVSPLAQRAEHALVISNESPSFFSSIAAAVAAVETLIILMVAEGGSKALKAIGESEQQLESFDAYLQQGPKKRKTAPKKTKRKK